MDAADNSGNIYLLCDCNNFFVSCEKLFRPDLKNKPVAVLSNNDGVVVSRSNETKKLGIAMGTPVFKIEKEIRKFGITVFSSNFSLYLDISNRIMTTLAEFSDDVEIYSVDEAFIRIFGISDEDALQLAFKIKNTVATRIGIPIGIGIAKTKTLAKLANYFAKKHPETSNVFSALPNSNRQRLLLDNPISEIWGVGKRLEEHLLNEGYISAFDLANADPDYLSKKFSIVVGRTVRELNNIDCIESAADPDNQQQIMWSRSFKDRLISYDDIYEAISNYTACACKKLRSLNMYATGLVVIIRTSFFGDKPKYANEASIRLDFPSSDTRVFISAAKKLLDGIFVEGYEYMKAGVILYNFTKDRTFQGDLFEKIPDAEEIKKSDSIMKTLDILNQNSNIVYLGAQNHKNLDRKFLDPKHKSPRYTTSFDELPEVF